jgi:formylglycine-generating enzyme
MAPPALTHLARVARRGCMARRARIRLSALLAAVAVTALVAGCNRAPPDTAPPSGGAVRVCPPPPAQPAFVAVPGGRFTKGANALYPEERPAQSLHVADFEIGAHEVTNAQFAAFVAATGYVTDAERSSADSAPGGGSAVFQFDAAASPGDPVPWRLVRGATWRTPAGPGSDIAGRDHWPVVHVSLRDARVYAAWVGARLPTEVEWEYAAARGLGTEAAADAAAYAGAYAADGSPRANTWQGFFPFVDEAADGFAGAAPAGCYAPDAHGAYDLIGNVWEWTDSPFVGNAPSGAGAADSITYTIKGGSFLCAENYCRRYRPAARQAQDADFSTSHIGIRLARDLPVSDVAGPPLNDAAGLPLNDAPESATGTAPAGAAVEG